MTKTERGEQAGSHYMRLGLLLLAILVTVAFLAFRSALETPSGEGVPGPAEWARHGQAQSGP